MVNLNSDDFSIYTVSILLPTQNCQFCRFKRLIVRCFVVYDPIKMYYERSG